MSKVQSTLSVLCLSLLLLPALAMAVPVESDLLSEPEEQGWWVETTVDRDGNGIGDMVEFHKDNPIFLSEDGTLPLIIDFDHTPGETEVALLEREIDFQHQWTLEGIDALAGRVPVDRILDATALPGVLNTEDGLIHLLFQGISKNNQRWVGIGEASIELPVVLLKAIADPIG